MPKPDPTARSVLAYLGVRAGQDGRHSHPTLMVMAHDLDLHPETVRKALNNLVDYGLIVEDGEGPEGQRQWNLQLRERRPADSYRVFERMHRGLAAAKKSRYRQKQAAPDVHRTGLGTSTAHDGGQPEVSTAQDGGRPQRTAVLSTAQGGSVYLENGPFERSFERSPADAAAPAARDPALIDIEPSPKPAPERPAKGYTDAFEAAWVAYGRKGAKRTAFAEWQRATKRVEASVITAAIRPYVQSTPELRYRKDFERWLKGDGWESVVLPADQASGHQGFRNHDPSVYSKPLNQWGRGAPHA